MKSVVLICNDKLGERMAGPAIRCVELARQLSSHFDVKLVANGHLPSGEWYFELLAPSEAVVQTLSESADVIIVQGDIFGIYPFLRECPAVVIADMYCPIPLEFHQSGYALSTDVRVAIGDSVADATSGQLMLADAFMCASERQRDLWIGAMMTLGRINAIQFPNSKETRLDDILSIVPFGFPDEWPQVAKGVLRRKFNIADNALVLLWGGGLYEWFDPLSIIQAIATLSQQGFDIHLVFMGVKHPNESITDHDMAGMAVELAKSLNVLDSHVHFNFGWVDYHDRINFLADADVGVSAHFDTPETRYSFRTRILDYLWASLPMVLTRGDFFSEKLVQHQMGVAVDYKDVAGWTQTLSSLYQQREQLHQYRQNVQAFRAQYQWSAVAKPLIVLCEQAIKSPDAEHMRRRINRTTISGKRSALQRVRLAYQSGGVTYVVKAFTRKVNNRLRR